MIPSLLQILLIGDSLFTSTATRQELERGGVQVTVDAKVGRRATEFKLGSCPDSAFVLLGSNDAVQGREEEGLAALRDLYRILWRCSGRLIILPPPGSHPRVRAFATRLFDHASPSGGSAVGFEVIRPEAYSLGTPDGVHLTVPGYRRLGRLIAEKWR